MSIEPLIAEGDWNAPATKGGLMLLWSLFEKEIRDVDSRVQELDSRVHKLDTKIDRVESRLDFKIDKVRSDLRIEIAKQGEEIAKLRVSMAWMTVAVMAGLGGLITLFEFLS